MVKISPRDVQSEKPEIPLLIERVGVKGVKRKINIYIPGETLSYDIKLNAYVDLPKDQRGIHMSRNIEVILESIDEASKGRYSTLEELFESICRKLLFKHSYASKAEVHGETTYFYKTKVFDEEIYEAAEIKLRVSVDKNDNIRWCTGVTIEGITVCPCAQVMYSELEGTEQSRSPSHTQRAKLFVGVETKGKVARIEWLIETARESFSAPTVSLLKRHDEYRLIRDAFKNAKFIEDVVRNAIYNIAIKLLNENFPLDTRIIIEGESFESIHPFNAYAYRHAYLRDLYYEVETHSINK